MDNTAANDVVKTVLEVSIEGGFESLRQIRTGEKVLMTLEPAIGDETHCVRADRWDGTPIGYLNSELSSRIGPFIEKAPGTLTGTVVELAPNRDTLPEPEVTIEFSAPLSGFSLLPRPAAGGDDTSLVPTDGYPHPYAFKHFNPVQSAVFPLRANGNNIVISANTSAGKTIAAELVVDDTLDSGQKVVYLSPFKALTEERHADWKKRYAGKRLVITTGDYKLTPALQEDLRAADIVVMTSEMMDSRTRKFESERNDWMREVGLVVVDEAHILSTPRGDKVETGLMRFTRFCPQARLVLLSATVSNHDEIGAWLTSLNGKPTDVVHRDWRPVKLEFHFVEHREFRTFNGKLDYNRTEDEKIALAVEQVMLKPAEKFLVFVHTKKTGSRIVAELKKRGVKALYHNGDLDLAERAAAESSFKDRANGTRVLVSTSTTAWGVNLPARNVVVVGVTRGRRPVDELDIIQMAGRAGRYGIDDEGHVFLIVPIGSRGDWEETFRKPRPVTSVLNDHERLVAHVLAEIYTGLVGKLSDVFTWYHRSLAHRQAVQAFSNDDIRKVVEKLVSLDMIRIKRDQVAITPLGTVSAVMYFPPEDIHAWRMNFNRVFEKGLQDNDHAIAWALADAPSFAMEYLPADFSTLAEDWAATLSEFDIRPHRFNVPAVLAVHACLAGAKPFFGIGSLVSRFRSDHLRILNALRMVDKSFTKWDRADFWEKLGLRLTRNKMKAKAAPKSPAPGPHAGQASALAPVKSGMERMWIYAHRDGRVFMAIGSPSVNGRGAILTPMLLAAEPEGLEPFKQDLESGEMTLVGTFDAALPPVKTPQVGDGFALPLATAVSTIIPIEKKLTQPHWEDTDSDDEPYLDDHPSWSQNGRYESEDDYFRDKYREAGWEGSEGNFFPESWSPD